MKLAAPIPVLRDHSFRRYDYTPRVRYKRIFWVILAPIAFLFVSLAEVMPRWTERFYSRGIYPPLSTLISRFTGLFSVSVVEICIYIAILSAIAYLIVQIRGFVRDIGSRKDRALRMVSTLAAIGSVWYSLSVFMCGINYHRLTFTEYSGLFVRDSSVEELAALCGELVASANSYRELVAEDVNSLMTTSFSSYYDMASHAPGAYSRLSETYDFFSGFTPRPKPVLASRAMSHMNIVGVFIPFTYECNVNTDVPAYNIPSSMMHELAHFKGFMREDETNYIAWLACMAIDNPEFAYSGTMLALIHSSNALYSADKEIYGQVMEPLSEAVRRDFGANSDYWKQFEGPVSEVSTAVNNTYLRVNKQSDGVKSYGRMVDLLLAEYRQRHDIA